MSCTASAQSRPGSSGSLSAALKSDATGEPSFEELAGSNPCPRWNSKFQEDSGIKDGERNTEKIFKGTAAWLDSVRTRICMEGARSDAMALAWGKGLDEYGVPLTPAVRARKLAELEAWLRSLIGKFRVEGKRWNGDAPESQVQGTADCFGIGSGPGVSCLISAEWKLDNKSGKGRSQATASPAIRPQVLLFGIDPEAMEIRLTHVDAVAVESHGFLHDGAVIFKERWPPLLREKEQDREMADLSAQWCRILGGKCPSVAIPEYQVPLSRLPMNGDGNYPRRLSRIGMTRDGRVDMQFYVLLNSFLHTATMNSPIEFDLQLHRETLVEGMEPGSSVATSHSCERSRGSDKVSAPDEQLLSASVRQESGTRQIQAWLQRLVGRFSVEGYVDLCGQGDPQDQRSVTGDVDCIAAGSPSSVHCNVNISWPPATSVNDKLVPGRVSHLSPAQFLVGVFTHEANPPIYVPTGGNDKRGLYLLQLDGRDIAEWAASELMGDTFKSTHDCFDMPNNCRKTTRITAMPDSNEISMEVDIEAGRSRVRQVFRLRRQPGARGD